jgi:outer membrane protein assembly factor BamA
VVHAQRAALIYDSRDSLTAPSRGLFTSLFAEASARLLGSSADYVKSGVESIYHWPVIERRVIVVGRGLLEAIDGDPDTPFMVRPSLGGVDSLRGFSDNRFFGDARVLLSGEVRARVVRLRLFGVDTEFEVAPFVDVGKVFNTASQFFGKAFEVTPGVGFRGLAPPSVVGHIEVGFSREGPAIFVGLDYPF